MNGDDKTQRMMEFLLEQQAHLAATVGTLAEQLGGLTKEVRALAEVQQKAEKLWERTEESIRGLLAIAETHEREINSIKEAQDRTDKQMAETDERLNAFINFVERYLSNGRRRDDSEGDSGDDR